MNKDKPDSLPTATVGGFVEVWRNTLATLYGVYRDDPNTILIFKDGNGEYFSVYLGEESHAELQRSLIGVSARRAHEKHHGVKNG